MSEWNNIKSEDIEVNHELEEVGILVKQDDFGNVYATLTFDQWRHVLEEIEVCNG